MSQCRVHFLHSLPEAISHNYENNKIQNTIRQYSIEQNTLHYCYTEKQ